MIVTEVPPVSGPEVGDTLSTTGALCPASAGSTHCPLWQLAPAGQGVSQCRQCCGSLERSTHEPEHVVVPLGQTGTHVEPPHASLAPHDLSQLPQCCGSLAVLTQVSLQMVWPAGQAHRLVLLQTWLPGQELAVQPQAPEVALQVSPAWQTTPSQGPPLPSHSPVVELQVFGETHSPHERPQMVPH
jgi:hypothetical protein